MTATTTLLEGADGSLVRRSVLSNGVRLISEFVPSVHSVSIGIWVDAGSRNEHGSHMGAAHYLEHLLFKGTQSRTALQISSAIEAVGGGARAARRLRERPRSACPASGVRCDLRALQPQLLQLEALSQQEFLMLE